MNLFTLFGIVVVSAVAVAVYRANPARATNRAFVLLSIVGLFWQIALAWLDPASPHIVLWLSITHAIGALFPWLMWLLKECVRGAEFGRRTFVRSWPWIVAGGGMACLCFTPYFIPAESTPAHPITGWAWSIYPVVIGSGYFVLLLQTLLDLRRARGIQLIELQILLLGGTAAGLSCVAVSVLARALQLPEVPQILRALIVAFYVPAAWAVTSRKIFDASLLFRVALSKAAWTAAAIVILLVGIYWAADELGKLGAVALCAILLGFMDWAVRRTLRDNPVIGEPNIEATRKSLLAASRQFTTWESFEQRFCEILAGWGQCEHAYIFTESEDGFSAHGLGAPLPATAVEELRAAGGWATPEMLQRRLLSGARSKLMDYLRAQSLSAIVSAPTGVGTKPLLIAQGVRYDGRPVTWNQIKLLQDWASIIENALARVSLSQSARDAEQLATAGLLGASLAHEIRNPLVTIKSVVQAAPARFQEPEFKRLLIEVVPGEIVRIERLVESLMDLGRPKQHVLEDVGLNGLVESSVGLVQPKAKEQQVVLTARLEARPDIVQADPGAIRQVMLNLVMNAIDAVSAQFGPRAVDVVTRREGDLVVVEISDNGPGVPHEIRDRLFRPFTTINKTTGIGLGLAISAEIVRAHHGRISLLDREGSGATFRVTLPGR